MMTVREKRPVFLNLLRIRMPVTAMLSIAHRISGALLFLAIPIAIYLLRLSLSGPEGYAQVLGLFEYRAVRMTGVIFLWSYVHHLLAGIRFILLDVDIGIRLQVARVTAWAVNLVGIIAFATALGGWW